MGIKEYFKNLTSKDFIKGMGSILNMAGSYQSKYDYNQGQKQDTLALRRDWEAVGNDLRCAMNKHKKSLLSKLKN